MGILTFIKIKLWRRKCCCCGRKLRLIEVAVIGPENLVWCEDCKGAASVYQQIWLEERIKEADEALKEFWRRNSE